MVAALASGFPVAFALPGSAIIAIGFAAFFGKKAPVENIRDAYVVSKGYDMNDVLKLDNGSEVQISKCPNGHGKIKSPICCGKDMSCNID